MNKLLICMCFGLVIAASAMPSDEEYKPSLKAKGAARELLGKDLKEAEDTINDSLSKLAAGEGPHYKLSKIHKATKQTVSGSLYKIKADLIDQDEKLKPCNVEIWSQPWLPNGIKVTFNCDGEKELIKQHSA